MNPAVTRLIFGTVLVAGLSHFLDPTSGRRRREELRQRFSRAATKVTETTRAPREGIASGAKNLAGKASSGAKTLAGKATSGAKTLAGKTTSMFKEEKGSNEWLARRIRAAIAKATSRSKAIGVGSYEGKIVLHGDVLPHEHAQVLQAVRAVEGVTVVTDHLADRDTNDRAWSLATSHSWEKPGAFNLKQEHWSPVVRVLAGTMGSALLAQSVRRPSALSVLGGVVGGALLVRTARNEPLKQLGRGHGVIDVHKTIQLHAPVARVFRLLESFENYPAFMRNVRKVMRREDGSSHWVVAGPAGSTVEWDSVTTVNRPNEMIAWRSLPHSRIQHSGVVRFEAVGDDQTRLNIHLSYSPPAGELGHVAAKLLGVDPDTELDQELTRAKTFVETWIGADGGGMGREPKGHAGERGSRAEARRAASEADGKVIHAS